MSDPQMNTFLTGISAMTHSEDPNHEVYLRTCFVCGSTSKPGQDFIRNYGGIVCYGCRAFFRRSHQSTKTQNYVCKNSSCSPIATENRQSCKSCRYTRCLRAGMKPELVLSEDQKLIRFRKVLSKKKRVSLQTQVVRKVPSLPGSNHFESLFYPTEDNNVPAHLETSSAKVTWPQASLVHLSQGPQACLKLVSSSSASAFPIGQSGNQGLSKTRRLLPEPSSSATLAGSHEKVVAAYKASVQQLLTGKSDKVKLSIFTLRQFYIFHLKLRFEREQKLQSKGIKLTHYQPTKA